MMRAHGRGKVAQLGARSARASLMLPSAMVMVGFVLVPLVLLVYFGLLSGPNVDGPVTGEEWARIINDPQLYGRLLVRSIWLGLAATVLTIIIGLPTSWAISRHVHHHRSVVLACIIIPLLTSSLLLIYAVYVLIAPGGALMTALAGANLAESSDTILFTRWAVLLMLTYLFTPLMIVTLFVSIERIDDDVLDAARSLGAGPFARFIHVIFPLALPGMMAGLVIVFTPAAGSFVEAGILGGTDGMMFGTLISEQISRVNNQPRAAAMSIALLVTILGLLILVRTLAKAIFPGAVRRR